MKNWLAITTIALGVTAVNDIAFFLWFLTGNISWIFLILLPLGACAFLSLRALYAKLRTKNQEVRQCVQ